MYELGQLMVYGIHGVCRIADRQIRVVDRKKVEYLVLEPIGQVGTSYLVPMGNPNALAKLRPVMLPAELEALLTSKQIRQNNWIPEENARKQYYRTLMSGSDLEALLQMICTLEQHKQEQIAAGKKFHQCDENFLRDAQRLIEGEFSVVLGLQPAEVGAYIQTQLKK